MKAYVLWEKNYDEKGQFVVFAHTAAEAKKRVCSTDLDPDEYIDVMANRAPEFDGMENATEREIAIKKS